MKEYFELEDDDEPEERRPFEISHIQMYRGESFGNGWKTRVWLVQLRESVLLDVHPSTFWCVLSAIECRITSAFQRNN
jgi:hypothetical protein